MSNNRCVIIMPDWHIYVSRCGVRKSCKEPLTITNYLKKPLFLLLCFHFTDTNLIGSAPNSGLISGI